MALLDELTDVLSRPRIRSKYRLKTEASSVDDLASSLAGAQDDYTPTDRAADLALMASLSDQDLWTIARSAMSGRDQETLAYLSELQSQRPLSDNEMAKLDALRQTYGQVTLRKARAYALLSLRGGKPLLAEN
jgi:hypothetical protein